MSKILDELVSASPNRRGFLKSVGAATAALCATTLVGTSAAHAEEVSETDILNFALNLEYLEAEFYTYASSVVLIRGKKLQGKDHRAHSADATQLHPYYRTE